NKLLLFAENAEMLAQRLVQREAVTVVHEMRTVINVCLVRTAPRTFILKYSIHNSCVGRGNQISNDGECVCHVSPNFFSLFVNPIVLPPTQKLIESLPKLPFKVLPDNTKPIAVVIPGFGLQ